MNLKVNFYMFSIKYAFLTTILSLVLISPVSSYGDTASEIQALKNRLEELEKSQAKQEIETNKKTETLASEIEKSKLSMSLPEKAELKSQWGFGPAASSVYNVKQGLSIGGYGETNLRSFVNKANGKKDETDALRLVTYLGYKFSDSIIFNSEIEFEHGTTDGIGGQDGDSEGEVSVEFSYLDFLIDKGFNARLGLVLIPMGFINEVHEPAYFHGVVRPEVERLIIPATWRENGVGFFGEFDTAGKLEYRTYLVNGLRASRFTESGIRDGRQKGNRALVEDIAWTGRVDYSPSVIPGLLTGGSFWVGQSGQDEDFSGTTTDANTTILSTHAQYRYKNLELRALGAWGSISNADKISTAVGKTIGDNFYGWYAESAYNVLPFFSDSTQYLAPFFRFESFDTQSSVPNGYTKDESLKKQVYTTGITYKPLTNVALKLDYRHFATNGAKETADEVALGLGFSF